MYREKILHAFPVSLTKDVEKVIEILPLNDHNILLGDGQMHNVDNLIHPIELAINVDNEVLNIPTRIYFNEPSYEQEKLLPDLQKTILNCIYLRHHNGFIRQRRLEQLIDKTDYFVVPFVFQLLGEYVLEILVVLERHINKQTIDAYIKFIVENKKYFQQTESRMISYWNQYYRRPKFKKLNDYIGKQVIDRLKNERIVHMS